MPEFHGRFSSPPAYFVEELMVKKIVLTNLISYFIFYFTLFPTCVFIAVFVFLRVLHASSLLLKNIFIPLMYVATMD